MDPTGKYVLVTDFNVSERDKDRLQQIDRHQGIVQLQTGGWFDDYGYHIRFEPLASE